MPPDASPPTTTKPPRRRKAKRAVANPAAPKKPRVTLLSRIEAMGPTHLAAYRTLAQGSVAFTTALAAALKADEDLVLAKSTLLKATRAVADAERRVGAAQSARDAGRDVLSRLDRLARDIATARGDVPATDDAHEPTVAPASAAD